MKEPNRSGRNSGLNPSLKSRQDTTFDTARRTPPPVTTTSTDGKEGRGWPWIWLVVLLLCVLLAVYILIW